MSEIRAHNDGMSLTTISTPEGQTIIMDPAMVEFLSSTAPEPTQATLDALLAQVHAVRVHEGGSNQGKTEGKRLLLETAEPASLKSLQAAMLIVDGGNGHCMCFGDPTMEFNAADESRLALISMHHGLSIRWDAWHYDAKLVDGRMLLDWLAQRGVTEPLKEFEKDEARRRKGEKDRERWLAAMPKALAGGWSAAEGIFGFPDIAPLKTALESDLPDERCQIRALLEWYGSGAGRWSGFPAYEVTAERLLLDYSTAGIIKAVESAALSVAQREGAARLFAGWEFGKQRAEDVRDLPGYLKRLLWQHVKDTDDSDKRSRAKIAFATGWPSIARSVLAWLG